MKKMLVVAALIMAVIFAGVSPADQIEDMQKQLQQIQQDYETKIADLQAQINQLRADQEENVPQAEVKTGDSKVDVEYVGRYNGPFEKGGVVIKNPSGFGNVSVGGYADFEYENFQNTDSTFDQHRWILNIGAELSGRLRFFSEYEIEHGGPDASGDGEAKVEQAWIDYMITDAINIRAGALLMPFGRYNIYHDSDLQDLTDRPLVVRDIIPTTWTESGAGIYGAFNPVLGSYEDLEVEYELYVVNGLNDGFSDGGLRGARGSLGSDNNNSKSVVGRLALSPSLGHEVGFSGYWGNYNELNDAITGGAIDWMCVWGQLEFIGEYAYFDVDEPAGSDVADTLEGYYLQANYHFWPPFLSDTFLGTGFENPTFTLIGRYGSIEIDDDADDDIGDNEEQRFTLGVNYRPVESWVFKMEHQWNSTDAESLERGDNNGFAASMAIAF